MTDVATHAAVGIPADKQGLSFGQPGAIRPKRISPPSWKPAEVFATAWTPSPQQVFPRGENFTRRYHEPISRDIPLGLSVNRPTVLAKSPEDGRFNLLPEEIDEHTLAAGRMVFDPSALDQVVNGQTSRVLAPTLTDEVLTLEFQKIKTRSANTHTLIGRVEGEGVLSMANLVYHDGIIHGSIMRYDTGKEIEYRTLADGHMMVREVDHSSITHKCQTCENGLMASDVGEDFIEDTGEYTIRSSEEIRDLDAPGLRSLDVVVGYGKEARIADGGYAQIEARIIDTIDRTTLAYENSGIMNAEIVLLGTIEDPDYAYSATNASGMNLEISALRTLNGSDGGSLDTVTDFGDQLGADIITFVIKSNRGATAGVASPGLGINGRYAIIARTGMSAGQMTFAHETGHILGCTHAWGDTNNNLDNSRYAWRLISPISGNKYRTITAYNLGSGGTTIPYYSNPNIYFDGARTGAVDGYNVLNDPTADPLFCQENGIRGFDGANPALGANNAEVIDIGDSAIGQGLDYNIARSTRTAFNVISPAAAAQWERGTTQTIQFNGGDYQDLASIVLYKGGVLHSTIAADVNPATQRNFLWTVPFELLDGPGYMIRVVLQRNGDTLTADSGIFTIFSDPPYVISSAAPAVPAGIGQISKVELTFNVPMDTATFSSGSDIIAFTDPIGNSVISSITGISWSASNTILTINFTPSSQPGTYQLIIGPNIADTVGSLMDQDGDGATGESVEDRHITQFAVNPSVIYYANMDTDPGWTFSANNPATNGWAYGQPTGQGLNPFRNNDPNSGFTGSNVMGYNLSGDYQTSIPDTRWATTPAFNCSGRENVTLSFKRWLGVSANDHVYIQVSNNATSWVTVWQYPSNTTTDDNSWVSVDYDLSAVADGQAAVYVRWGLGQTFSDINGGASGWNIDDVVVQGTLSDNLAVTPAGTLPASGVSGGPFSPTSIEYTLQNTGTETIQWTAGKAANWVTLSASSGTLGAAASTTVTVSINSQADVYTVGDYSDVVTFTNATAGKVSATRSVDLEVLGPGTLEVSPVDDLVSSGVFAGLFSPDSIIYTLTNGGVTPINWTAVKNQSWVTLSSTSGSLSPGASTSVTVSINGNADALNAGSHDDLVSFSNQTNESGDTTRGVSLTVFPPPADHYWDANGNTAGAGSTPTGTWGTSNFWNTNATGVAGTFSTSKSVTSNLFFVAGPASNSGNGNATITVSGDQAANSLTSQHSGNFTLSGGSSTPLGTISLGNGTAGQGGITVNEFAYGSTVQGKLSISAPVSLNNPQRWTNNKQDSDFRQQTATLDLTAASGGLANGLTLNHALTIDGKGVTSLSANTNTTISGTGGITKNGTGTLILNSSTVSADNSGWSGGLTINGGIVRFQNALNLGTGNVNLAGGVLEGRSGTTSNLVTRDLGSGANQIRITGGVSGFSGQSSTATVFTVTGSNPLVWGSTNFAPAELVLQASTANTNGAATFTNSIDLNGATRTIRSDQTGGLAAGGLGTFTGRFTGTGNLIKTGIGQLYINSSSSNNYTGTTTVSQGTLTLENIGSVPGYNTSGRVIVSAGATLGVKNGSWTPSSIDNLRNNVTWSDTSSELGFSPGSTSVTYASNITQALSIHKYGTNTLVLTGSSSFTGTTTVSQGTLAFNSIANVGGGNSALGNPATIANGTIALGGGTAAVNLQYTGTGHSTNRILNLSNTTGGVTLDMNGTGTLAFSSALTATGAGSKTLTLTGSTAGIGQLSGAIVDNSGTNTTAVTKTGSGTWELLGSSSYSGRTTISQGTIAFNSIANVGAGNSALGAPTTATNGTIALGNAASTVGLRYTGTGHSTNRVINLAGTTGSATLDMSGTETLTFTSPLTATGAGSKTLTLAGSTAGMGALGGAIVNNSATNITSLSKTGTGTWLLSGANSYTGTTTVSAGKLFINGNQSTASGAVGVSGLATLGGTGTLGGNTEIADTGTLEFSLSTTPGSHDKLELAAGKTLSFGANATLIINSLSGATTGDYTLLTAPGGIGTLPAFALNLPSGWSASVTRENSNTDLVLHVTSLGGTVDHFVISAFSSPQTVGTPITGIILTAQNAANQTATSFTGTVTFGGTAGITGSSASFVAGVLSGVSVTPTVAGANLTLTINDGAGHTGSANFSVLTPYSAWASTFVPADVSNPAGNNDGDTLTNLLEFAFGMNPTSPVLAPLSYVTTGNTIPGFPILENTGTAESPSYRAVFGRRKDHANAGISYQVQFSANLLYWKAGNEAPVILSGVNSDPIETVCILFPVTVPLSAAETEHASPKFFRVVVSGN